MISLREVFSHFDFFDPVELLTDLRSRMSNVSESGDVVIDDEKTLDLLIGYFASKSAEYYRYDEIAVRIAVDHLHSQTPAVFSECVDFLKNANDIINDETWKLVMENADVLNSVVDHSKDYSYTLFGFNTMKKSYLLKHENKIVERPQHMLMRAACGIWSKYGHNKEQQLQRIIDTYRMMSDRLATHATPTLFNAGTRTPQCSSCFLLASPEDSIAGIYDTLSQCAVISKNAGGIGLPISKIRSKGSYIKGTNGISQGIVPMMSVYDATARYCDQGGSRRNGSFAMYLEPWHADVEDFLMTRTITDGTLKFKDLFIALWIPDLFMKRVYAGEDWTLMCPSKCPGLDEVYGEEFEELYERYEREGLGVRTIKAWDLYKLVLRCQFESGLPYITFKDQANRVSNHRYLGVIKSSNLCAEIYEYANSNETAVCNLSSIALNRHIKTITREEDGTVTKKKVFDYDALERTVRILTRNLDQIIDINFYPTEQTRRSNLNHRPIGIGIQGLADLFHELKLDFDSPEAVELSRSIAEKMYYVAIDESINLNIECGGGRSTELFRYPSDDGEFHHDHYPNVKTTLDWESLRQKLKTHKAKNSLMIAIMPTASTSQILGNNESYEPYSANIYSRRVKAGDYLVINRALYDELKDLNLLTLEMSQMIVKNKGSVQSIPGIPDDIKRRYRTVWELPTDAIIKHAIARQPFVDQGQSMNLYVNDTTDLIRAHKMAWVNGLKTGSYYIRTKPQFEAKAILAEKNTSEIDVEKRAVDEEPAVKMCKWRPGMSAEGCEMCSG